MLCCAAKFFWYVFFMFIILFFFTCYGMTVVAVVPNIQVGHPVTCPLHALRHALPLAARQTPQRAHSPCTCLHQPYHGNRSGLLCT